MKKYLAIVALMCFCTASSFGSAHLATRTVRTTSKVVAKGAKVAKKVAVATFKTIV